MHLEHPQKLSHSRLPYFGLPWSIYWKSCRKLKFSWMPKVHCLQAVLRAARFPIFILSLQDPNWTMNCSLCFPFLTFGSWSEIHSLDMQNLLSPPQCHRFDSDLKMTYGLAWMSKEGNSQSSFFYCPIESLSDGSPNLMVSSFALSVFNARFSFPQGL
jgi:hypothetical protein